MNEFRGDPYNFNTEWEKILFDGAFSFNEVKKLYAENKISQEEYEYAKDYLEVA